MYIVYQIENHPDRCLGDMCGPFSSYEKAHEFAKKCEADPSNYNGPHRLHDFIVEPLVEIE